MNTSKYYTPSVEEFTEDFRFEINSYRPWDSKDVISKHEWDNSYPEFLGLYFTKIKKSIANNNIRVKYLDQQDIEELGWTYTGKTTELWFGIPEANVQPFNLTYRSFRLSYNLTDHRLMILGYEYENYKDFADNGGEFLFLGKIKNYNELKQVMKFLNIIE